MSISHWTALKGQSVEAPKFPGHAAAIAFFMHPTIYRPMEPLISKLLIGKIEGNLPNYCMISCSKSGAPRICIGEDGHGGTVAEFIRSLLRRHLDPFSFHIQHYLPITHLHCCFSQNISSNVKATLSQCLQPAKKE
jgi:hypothetical protein